MIIRSYARGGSELKTQEEDSVFCLSSHGKSHESDFRHWKSVLAHVLRVAAEDCERLALRNSCEQ
jgi:diaminopimelate decarboxylase